MNQAQNILGIWELRQTSGGMMPGAIHYPSGNGHLLQFVSASYQLYAGGQLQKSGAYTILPDTRATTSVCLVLPAGQYGNRVIFDNNDSTTKQFFQIAGNTLTFLAGCFALDGGRRPSMCGSPTNSADTAAQTATARNRRGRRSTAFRISSKFAERVTTCRSETFHRSEMQIPRSNCNNRQYWNVV